MVGRGRRRLSPKEVAGDGSGNGGGRGWLIGVEVRGGEWEIGIVEPFYFQSFLTSWGRKWRAIKLNYNFHPFRAHGNQWKCMSSSSNGRNSGHETYFHQYFISNYLCDLHVSPNKLTKLNKMNISSIFVECRLFLRCSCWCVHTPRPCII